MASNGENAVNESWRKQKKAAMPIVITEAVMSVILTVGIFYGGYYLCDSIPVPSSGTFADSMTYYIRCCVFPCCLVVFTAIMFVARKRGSTPAGNPLSGNEHFLLKEKNILANTVEQALVFLMLSLVLTTYLDPSKMKIIPLYSLQWVVGRILFQIGYGINPVLYRAFGMLMNIGATFLFIGVVSYLICTRGIMYGIVSSDGPGNWSETSPKAEL